MPCLLKLPTTNSPGIITFTHNEVLRGVPAKSKKVKEYLKKSAEASEWIYGVHIQGDCSYLKTWPLEKWQSFVMWPDTAATILAEIPPAQLTSITCVNFIPKPESSNQKKKWDICVVSRPSEIKKITETLLIIKELLKFKQDLKVCLIVPDPRNCKFGEKAYKKQDIDRNFFELPKHIFTCAELKNISFISSSQVAFGTFPISDDLVADIIGRSKFLLLTSRREGIPRVIAEAFTLGTPCIISISLISGLQQYLNSQNTLFIEEDISEAAHQILKALSHYDRFNVDANLMQKNFCDVYHIPKLKAYLSERIVATGRPVDGKWCLDDLDLRLACHGQKHNSQFMNNEQLFFDWIEKILQHGSEELCEDYFFGNEPLDDKQKITPTIIIKFIKSRIFHPIVRRLRSYRII
jgi:glycosyltransferase involved in cell wall biosynthesis